jgi:surface antigen-like variable number repeat protein
MFMLMTKGQFALLVLAVAVVGGGAGEPGQQMQDSSRADGSGQQVLAPSLEKAAKDFKSGEFYDRTGHSRAARFYYELVQRRYPNTKYAKLAAARIQQLKSKPPTLIGQIFIVGNTKTEQGIILDNVQLYPGAVLKYPDLQQAERNLRKLGIFEDDPVKGTHPTVLVMDPNGDSPYKDILIQVQEKK